MSLTSGKMLGISITLDSKKKILEEIQRYLMNDGRRTTRPLVIVTPNPEQMVLAQHNERFAKLLNGADVAVPDGIGTVWGAKILGVDASLQRIPGIELLDDLAGMAAKRGVRIGLIGGRGDLAVRALERLQKRHFSLDGEARSAPKIKIENRELKIENKGKNLIKYITQTAEWIKEKKIQILFVGLGAPKQELFIGKLARRFAMNDERTNPAPIILMSVGGSFDILAGRVSRAPFFIRMMGFEWLWRLIREPWRFRRQLSLLTFIRLILFERFRSITK